ncbi:hypothetical protein LCGC14_0195350 [marine sediment metagenome]|uniref:Uncharacterized protein n=1 Tax=marine sediment metagenome TaxID=412755 RepID=A0A0F9V1V5_9ZZZZ
MGEYYKFVNLQKREFIDPGQIGFTDPVTSGGHNIKESSFKSNVLASFCMYLLLYGGNNYDWVYRDKEGNDLDKPYRKKGTKPYRGRWAGDPVMYLGDSLDAKDSIRYFQQFNLKPGEYVYGLSDHVGKNFTDITRLALAEFLEYSGMDEKYFHQKDNDGFTWDDTHDVVYEPPNLFGPSTMHFMGCETLTNIFGEKDPPGTIFVTEEMLLTEDIPKYFGNESGEFNQCGECFIPFRIKMLRKNVADRGSKVKDFVNTRLNIIERGLTNKNYAILLRDLNVQAELSALDVGLDFSENMENEEDEYQDFLNYWLK